MKNKELTLDELEDLIDWLTISLIEMKHSPVKYQPLVICVPKNSNKVYFNPL